MKPLPGMSGCSEKEQTKGELDKDRGVISERGS